MRLKEEEETGRALENATTAAILIIGTSASPLLSQFIQVFNIEGLKDWSTDRITLLIFAYLSVTFVMLLHEQSFDEVFGDSNHKIARFFDQTFGLAFCGLGIEGILFNYNDPLVTVAIAVIIAGGTMSILYNYKRKSVSPQLLAIALVIAICFCAAGIAASSAVANISAPTHLTVIFLIAIIVYIIVGFTLMQLRCASIEFIVYIGFLLFAVILLINVVTMHSSSKVESHQ